MTELYLRISVTSYSHSGYNFGVVGSIPELGQWDVKKCVPLIPYNHPVSEHATLCQPTLWFWDIPIKGLPLTPNPHSVDLPVDLPTLNLNSDLESLVTSTPVTPALKSWLEPLSSLSLQYKFIRWRSSPCQQSPLCRRLHHPDPVPAHSVSPPTSIAHNHEDKANDMYSVKQSLGLFAPLCSSSAGLQLNQPDLTTNSSPLGDVDWEGSGSFTNRTFTFNSADLVCIRSRPPPTDVTNSDHHHDIPDHCLCILPTTSFIDPGNPSGTPSEYEHTTRYYYAVKDSQAMHYHKVLSNVYCGTTPRSVEHLEHLKSQMGVTCVVNLQTHHDALNTSPLPPPSQTTTYSHECPDSVVEHMYSMYHTHHLTYLWLPTTDMSTPARAAAIPQASRLMKGLLEDGKHIVYVHCNAGVGRSVASVCGYLCCALGLPLRCVEFLVRCRRSVAYWDEVAMTRARQGYDRMFRTTATTTTV
eukprot:GHVQ01001034.1.p1 GENE.GHVQ01001034.1~~GHVQ01001034.1.p1  ORF type:complete len:470 (+),score=37.86 GHVQ01001034.1:804-2213(+)